jgi:hypothetical protein
MSQAYNIFCDESCHLQNDDSNIMVLGAVACPEHLKKSINNDIRDIKNKYDLSTWLEIKWTKVSESKIEFYNELIDYFFSNNNLSFRGVVARNKKELDHNTYNNGDYNEWYYKMYFRLLDPLIYETDEYRIFIDIKDTNGGPKVRKLHDVLCNNIYDFKQEVIKDIKQINSKESEILQMSDLLIGALSYYHRKKQLEPDANKGKVKILERLYEKHGIILSRKTDRRESKFNIFIWEPRRY